MAEKLAIHGGSKVREKGFPSVGNASGRMIGDEEKALVMEVLDSGALNRTTVRKRQRLRTRSRHGTGVKDCRRVIVRHECASHCSRIA